jgi:L-fucose mutarotase
MLKGIDPFPNADVLGALGAMRHGEDLITADTNFPSQSVAAETGLGRLLHIDQPAARVVRAVLSVYPLNTFVDDTAARMEVVGAPDEIPDVPAEVQREVEAAEGRVWLMIGLERFDFYARAKRAFAVVQTAERRFYGCFVFRKGVIPPDA